jgi:hypothetical protein
MRMRMRITSSDEVDEDTASAGKQVVIVEELGPDKISDFDREADNAR